MMFQHRDFNFIEKTVSGPPVPYMGRHPLYWNMALKLNVQITFRMRQWRQRLQRIGDWLLCIPYEVSLIPLLFLIASCSMINISTTIMSSLNVTDFLYRSRVAKFQMKVTIPFKFLQNLNLINKWNSKSGPRAAIHEISAYSDNTHCCKIAQ